MANDRRLVHAVDADDGRWLEAALWGDSPEAVLGPDVLTSARSTGRAATGLGYDLLPSRRRPWCLVPRAGTLRVLRSLTAGLRQASWRSRLVRAVVAGSLLLPRRGRTAVPSVREDGHRPVERLLARARVDLGRPLTMLVAVGERDPNRKPTLQLCDQVGRAVAYAKVGWDDPTSELVENEAETLERLGTLAAPPAQLPRRPHVLSCFRAGGLAVLVTAPVPGAARRWRRPLTPVMVTAVALAVSGRRRLHELRLVESSWWDRLLAGLEAAPAAQVEGAGDLAAALESARSRAGARGPGPRVPFGGWHGDLVPWNLAAHRGEVWAWDWEHSTRDVPLGLDVLHHHFAVRRHVRRLGTEAVVTGLRADAAALLAPLGVSSEAAEPMLVGYLAERWLRAARLSRGGATWDRAVHPVLVDVLAGWGSSS